MVTATYALASAVSVTESIVYFSGGDGGFGASGVPCATGRIAGSSKAVPDAR
jgi:hypothetical protein